MTTIKYTGGGISGDWADPGNWAGGQVPDITNNVQVLDGASMTVGGPVSVNAIMIIEGGTDTFTGAVTTAGIGACQGFMVCIGSTVVFAPGSSLNDGGNTASLNGGGVLQVGVGGIGNFIATGSSTLPTTITTNSGTIGKFAAGVGTFTINDATWTTNQYVLVGEAGSGTLDVEAGGVVNAAGNFTVGENTGSSGTVNVAAGANITVGLSLYASCAVGAVGAINLASGASMTIDENAEIGSGKLTSPQGGGTLTIGAGSTFDVGNEFGVSGGGAVDVAGGTVSAGALLVGMTGGGTLDVGAGSHVSLSHFFALGYETGAIGTATLLSGSSVTMEGGASIGGGDAASPLGTGTLTVEGTSTFAAQGYVMVANGSAIDLAGGTVSAGLATGSVIVQAGGEISGYGTLATRTGGSFIDNGTIAATGGTLNLAGSVGGTGSIIINPDSTVVIAGTSVMTPALSFMSGTDETLSLATGAHVHGIIGGFNVGDQIEMAGIDSAVWSSAAHTLTLGDAGHTVSTLDLAGSYSNDVFSLTHTGNLGVITLHSASV